MRYHHAPMFEDPQLATGEHLLAEFLRHTDAVCPLCSRTVRRTEDDDRCPRCRRRLRLAIGATGASIGPWVAMAAALFAGAGAGALVVIGIVRSGHPSTALPAAAFAHYYFAICIALAGAAACCGKQFFRLPGIVQKACAGTTCTLTAAAFLALLWEAILKLV